jgi:hypothetical protein
VTEPKVWNWSPSEEREYILEHLDYVIGGLTAPGTNWSQSDLKQMVKNARQPSK